MGAFKKLIQKLKGRKNPYYGLRKRVLSLVPSDAGVSSDDLECVYAAAVDIPMGKDVATLACFLDGTVSLYYSTGGGMLGMGQRHPAVRDAGRAFLNSAGQVLHALQKAESFDLPKDQLASVYLMTPGGAYQAKYDMNRADSCEKHLQFLNFLIQKTLTAIRVTSGR